MRSIPQSIQDKINKQNQTIFDNADPKMSVVVARARSSIMDSTYFTVETIREQPGLTDISVATRRRKAYGPPDGLFVIHLEQGSANTLYRDYPDKMKLKWRNQFTVGSAKSVAICFDGHWERYREYWQLVTDDYPYVFWVANDGKLYTQLWNDVGTKFELATGVSKVKSVRGWKNVVFPEKDAGLIAGYIKSDGKIYYRNLCEQLTGEIAWENEQKLTEFTGTAVNLNMFLTNDYRVAFIVEDSLGKIHWYITDRNWAGMAIDTDKFSVKAKTKIDLLVVTYHRPKHDHVFTAKALADIRFLFARTDNSVVEVENVPMTRLNENLEEYQDWGFKVRVRFNYEIIGTPTISLLDSIASSEYQLKSTVEIKKGYEYELTVDDALLEFGFNIASADLSVTLVGQNPASYDYDALSHNFTPTNLVAPIAAIPKVEVIYNE